LVTPGATQLPQELTFHPNREAAGTQRDDGDQCYKQSNLLTRKYLGSTLTLMKISKLLVASRKSFVATKWGLLSQMLYAAFWSSSSKALPDISTVLLFADAICD